MMTGEQRYLHDPQFRQLVDFMVKAIIDRQYTPSEMRDAAMLASVKYEMEYSRRWMDAFQPPAPRAHGEKEGGGHHG